MIINLRKVKIKKVINSLMLIILGFFVMCHFIIVDASANGIGTVKDTYSRTILNGITYTYTESDNGDPQKNYVLEYNPKDTQVEALAVYGQYAFGGDTLSTNVALAESKGYTVIAGINGSPFDTSNGVTVGTLISNGVIISAKSGESGYDSFAIRKDGSMFISTSNLTFKYKTDSGKEVNINYINKQKKTANNNIYLMTSDYYSDTTSLASSTEVVLTVKEGTVSIGKEMTCVVEEVKDGATRTKIEDGKMVLVGPNNSALGDLKAGSELTFSFISNDSEYNWDEVYNSVCGFYEILKDGNPVNTSDPAVHPRTTVGFKADGTIVFFVVDGRQPTFSVGLTDLACAEYMKSLGCVAAIRMDGGGSSTMGLRLPGDNYITTVNSPSDGQERHDADGLLLVLKSDYDQTVGDDTLLHAYPNSVKLLQNTVMDIEVKATDGNYNAKETPEYKMEVLDGCGIITEDGKFKAKEGSGTGKIKITSGSVETYVNVSVTDKVDEIYTSSNNLALSPNEVVDLSVKAYYKNDLLICSNEAFTWTCSPEIGTIDASGKFTASSNAGVSGMIEVSYGDIKGKVVVTVGQLPVEITGFETDVCGQGAGQWRNNQVNGGTGSCSINEDLQYVKYGEKSLRIDFNLAGTTGTVGTQISTGANLTISGSPTAIGMWVYATESSQGAWIRLQYQQSGSSGAMYADFGHIDWTGWKYLEAPIDTTVTYPIAVRYLVRIMGVKETERINGTIYVDQLRAVYGFKNDDFDNPEITNITPEEDGVSTVTTQTISCDLIDTGSGINKDATKFYLDGEEITNILFKDIQDGYRISWTPSSLIPLKEGKHTIKVRAEDNYNNFVVKEWSLIVDSSLPKFSFDGGNEADLGNECTVSLKATNATFGRLEATIKYDPAKIKVTNVTVSEGLLLSDFGVDDITGRTAMIINNLNPGDNETVVFTVTYIPQVEGEATIELEKLSYKSSKYAGTIVKGSANAYNVTVVNRYDYSKFLDLASKFDEETLLSKLPEFRECLKEMKNFDPLLAKDEAVVKAIEKINKCIEKYQQIQKYVDGLNTSSSSVGNLIGGK